MSKIRITKEFSFEMAHALRNYDGPCRNIHGHSYKLFVTIIGEPKQDDADPKNGMLMDFGALKKLVNTEIVDKYDHSVVVYKNDERLPEMQKLFENIIIEAKQPTCENLVSDFASTINTRLPDNLSVFSIKLYETATSYAEWYASDNPTE
ncbi:6-pyruvoyl trahydropterin synthase family protein [Salinivirga cyanobacteriivorans]|uniref:6-carboxy-5,6,7,8-tetrahydropterin synthase n=1 Tax=Salinivirga cyanobacteriivorans TaxID=1307839 RepID=A0A0S2I090_9BACT|nr:6-carboxytetrahydropterin synthase [Salinivirga cyanobacteriivorans]ALO15634.1 6-carboxy-5,6,7,8-tetrahydropterin synthase [Salinivirga cyanobacteriivorans]